VLIAADYALLIPIQRDIATGGVTFDARQNKILPFVAPTLGNLVNVVNGDNRHGTIYIPIHKSYHSCQYLDASITRRWGVENRVYIQFLPPDTLYAAPTTGRIQFLPRLL
jgi:hypothetical protein